MLLPRRAHRILGLTLVLIVLAAGLLGYRLLVFRGVTEELEFQNAEVTLRGTLIKPDVEAPFPAVVVLHGSGPHTHDMAPYRIHANAFLRHGLAVLMYDKRGSGSSDGDFETASYRDFISDANAAVSYLRSRSDIQPTQIGLFGSSEGGWFTPEVATTAGNIAFIVNRCGPPLSWMETNSWEVTNEFREAGLSDDGVTEALALRIRIWKYYIAVSKDPALAVSGERDEINSALKSIINSVEEGLPLPSRLPDYDAEYYSRLAEDISYDPGIFLDQVDAPMLYVFAELDANLPTAQSVEYLEKFKDRSGKDITVRIYADEGHSLQHWTRPLSGGYVDDYLDYIGEWAASHVEIN